MTHRSIVSLLREQAEEVRRHHLRFLSPKKRHNSTCRPTRLPSVDGSAASELGAVFPLSPLPLSHLPRPMRRLPSIAQPLLSPNDLADESPRLSARHTKGRKSARRPASLPPPLPVEPDTGADFDPIVAPASPLLPCGPAAVPSPVSGAGNLATPCLLRGLGGSELPVGSPLSALRLKRRGCRPRVDDETAEPQSVAALREFQPPMELGPLGWKAHRLVVSLLAIYASQTMGQEDLALEAELQTLEALAQEYYHALLWLVNVVSFDLQCAARMARWPAWEARCGLGATLALAEALARHLEDLSDLAEHCATWAGQVPLVLLQHFEPSTQALQEDLRAGNVVRAVSVAERLPAPSGAEGAALAALLVEVRWNCGTAAQPCAAINHLFLTLRSYLVMRTVLSGAAAVPRYQPKAILAPHRDSALPALRGY